MKNLPLIMITLLLMVSSHHLFAQQSATGMLGLEDAQKISDAAQAKAESESWNVVIAVLDAGGHLISLRRMDGTQIGSVDVAQGKAATALKFKRPTKVFEDLVKAGNVHIMSLPGVVAVEGGLPIMHEGNAIGSIGISGVTSAQDGIIAAAALEAFQ